ncbi:rCG37313 [Rattus norvegicus]|uniref:RCG37313 n=1 Tax=Rattus norvegicus TaxID=10116 RepID=A6KHP4_RAT|nr:rCG37313 [Rattus norvegicus]
MKPSLLFSAAASRLNSSLWGAQEPRLLLGSRTSRPQGHFVLVSYSLALRKNHDLKQLGKGLFGF